MLKLEGSLIYKTTPDFWARYYNLPPSIQELANKNFQLLKQDRSHPSLEFKKVQDYWSAKVSDNYRALAVEDKEGYVWFWIGDHDEYMSLIRSKRRR